ncbi:uncharacterized protein LOC131664914 [Phymastichus coffea]|uniref:uncharacterized protein LOC131664914 n=1 Tax=Phymastichus coffea TaxID=108790 RepID=UPI00273CEE24|nr:uncharacterized protein LOC131664914 [Phymastichus coffea]
MNRSLTNRKKPSDPECANEAKGLKRRKKQPQHIMPTHRALVAANVTKNDRRLRGGGSSELEPASLLSSNADFTWYNRRFMMPNRAQQHRLEGGGGGAEASYQAAGCGKAARMQLNNCPPSNAAFHWESTNPIYLASNKCNIRHVEQSINNPVCSCPAKGNMEAMLKKKGYAMCTKKPCLGTDCLIKAFKDAQDFVDNIGKVPGLAGLGITESPYFSKPQDVKEFAKAESKLAPAAKQPEIQNLENVKKPIAVATPTTFPPVTTKKPGLVQEGTAALPDLSTLPPSKPKKKDEKIEKVKDSENTANSLQNIEDTPCGEPKCKSRPRKDKTVEMSGECHEKNEKSIQKGDKKGSSKGKLSPSGDRPKTAKSSKSAKANQFLYNFGNAYPASIYGHKTCGSQRPRVPAHMGWMWNKTDTITRRKPRPGWRPGAISIQLRDLLNEAKAGFFKEALRPRSAPTRSKKGKLQKTMSFTSKKGMIREDEEEPEIEYPPTLHIHRKDGIYYVTMYPIRQEGSDEPRLDEPINPLQFKIVKSKTSLASSSTASDMEIEFSPPAAVNRQKKKPNVIHVETQVKQQDILDASINQ